MSLAPFQEIVYWDRADVWAFTAPGGGRSDDPSYTLNASDVPCRFVTKSSVDQLQASTGILGESDDLLTVDTIRLPEGQACETSWILVNKTLLADGSHGGYYGKAWEVRGEPRRRRSVPGLPQTGRVVAFVTKLPANSYPQEIVEYYS